VRIFAFVLALVVAAPAALAQVDEATMARAQKHFKKGEKLYALGKFEDALKQYEKAYEYSELPELLFNIGQCHRNLDNYEEAIFSFKKYLSEKPAADNRAAVEKLIEELTEAQRKREAARPTPPRPRQRLEPVPSSNEPEIPPPPVYEEDSPFYTRWWFWGGVVVVGGAVAAGVLLLPGDGGVPSSDLGNLEFPR
jgi:hypothetical protein